MAELRTKRSVVRCHGPDDALAEVVHDAVEVMDGRRVAERFAEVEVELVAGNGGSLRKLGKRVAKAGAEPSDGRPKVFRALGLTGTAEGLPANAPFAARLGEMLRSAGRRDPPQRPGRAARRRPRGRPRIFGSRSGACGRSCAPRGRRSRTSGSSRSAELKWLGSEVMGPLRDLDVLVAHLIEQAEALGSEDIETALTARLPARGRARARPRGRARGARRGALRRAATALDTSVDGAAGRGRRLAGAHRREGVPQAAPSTRRVDADSSDEALHALRIAASAPGTPRSSSAGAGKRARRFVESARRLQDVLGDHQDAVVAEERIRELAVRADAGPARPRAADGSSSGSGRGAARRGTAFPRKAATSSSGPGARRER